jgi:hypothetical protein
MLREFNNIHIQLSRELPGLEAQMRMAPVVSGELNFNVPQLKAAVLVLLFPQDDSLYTVNMKVPIAVR